MFTPHPNTYTYEQLIRWCAFHGLKYKTLWKHYFNEAVRKDRKADAILRRRLEQCDGRPCGRPTVAVSEAMFRYITLAASRGHRLPRDPGLCLWLMGWAREVSAWKRSDIAFYDALDDGYLAARYMQPRTIKLSRLDSQNTPPVDESDAPGARIIRNPFNKRVHLAHLERDLHQINTHMQVIEQRLDSTRRRWARKKRRGRFLKVSR